MPFTSLGLPPAFDFPYPEWPAHLVVIVETAIAQAWTDVLAKGLTLAAGEDGLTDQLRTELVRLRKHESVDGFTDAIFAVPVRDGKLPNSTTSSIDQMPDLTFYLARSRPQCDCDEHDALFVEAKVIDLSKPVRLYCDQGVARFTKGDYAWRMQQAGMIAYVLPANTGPHASLTAHFAKLKGSLSHGARLGLLGPLVQDAGTYNTKAKQAATSTHARSSPRVSSAISIRHLWLAT